ncbi:MAG: divergent polysaccharide deacetylase family protein [Alphaproteobacteria bacterium]
MAPLAAWTRAFRNRVPPRLLVILIAALALGAILGIVLGTRQSAKQVESVPRPSVIAEAPAVIALPSGSPKSAPPIAKGRLAGPLALLPAEPEPRPAAGEVLTAPRATNGPRLITAEKNPSVVYEEAVEEPGPRRAMPAAPGAGPPHPGAERKPTLLAALEHLTIKPSEGPQPAWLQHALAMPDIRGRPMVALVIDDAGVDRKRTERAMHLPPGVTMSFLPYAQEVARQVQEAKALGHEIIVHVPMEPENASVDPGPNALRVKDSGEEIERRLEWDLSRFADYVGINNHMGSKFTQDAQGMRIVLEALKSRGLLFLDSRTTPASVGAKLARELGLPTLERDVFLDNVDSREAISARLAEVERIARRDGYVIAIGHPRDATLDVLERWTGDAGAHGLALVPLSAVMRALIAVQPEQAKLSQTHG